MRQRRAVGRWYLVLVVSLFLDACAAGSAERGTSRGYAQSMDSATSACRQNPAYCKAVAGEEVVVPLATREQAARVGASIAGALKLFDEQKEEIERILRTCVEQASAEVNLRWFKGSPTAAQCAEQVGVDAKGKPMTRAMTLGTEKHQAALRCIREHLSRVRPGGRGDELRGTLRPDVVIHSGNPLRAEAVYDLKFPCPGSNPARWHDYPKDHPYSRLDQGEVYRRALNVQPIRVAPGWGTVP